MTETETWFSTFWDTFPADLCHRKKGSRKKAWLIIEKMAPSKDMQNKILANLRELIRFYRLEKKADGKTDRWPMVTTWLNGECWENLADIGSYCDANERIAARQCSCGSDVEILKSCFSCHYKEKDKLYDRYLNEINVSNGIGKVSTESKSDYYTRCRERLVKGGGISGSLARE